MASGNPRGRKKGRSFLYKARKYGKKGLYGRGKNVDEDTYNYFVRVMERLKDEFEEDEEKEIFVTNVFEQTVDKEMDLMCNQVISKVIEKLLGLAKSDIRERYAEKCLKEMRIICTDPYASHVLERLMQLFIEEVQNNDDSKNQHVKFCEKWLCSVCQYTFNNIEDFIVDIYASHIIRTALLCVSGAEVDVNVMKSQRSRKHLEEGKESTSIVTTTKRPKEFTTILEEFAERFAAWPQLPDLVQTDNSSAVIQTFLLATSGALPTVCEKMVHILIDNIFPSMEGSVFECSSIIHLLEVCVAVCSEKTFKQIYEAHFRGHLKSLAEDGSTKFAVIRLLDSVKDTETFAEIFDELAPAMEDVFGSGCGAVVSALAAACRRLVTLQGKYLQHLMQAFHCFDPELRQIKIVPLVSRLVTYEVDSSGSQDGQPTFPVHYIGSQIVQTLLHFNKPIKIVNSLLEMETSQLKDLLCDPLGSHIMDAFVAGQYVGEKSRDRLAHKLQGVYFPLATSKHGSRALDALWQASDIKWRTTIGEELLQKEAALTSNMFGRILIDKYALPLLKKQKSDWKANQEKESKKRKIFADLIVQTEEPEPVRKKTKRSKKKKSSDTVDESVA